MKSAAGQHLRGHHGTLTGESRLGQCSLVEESVGLAALVPPRFRLQFRNADNPVESDTHRNYKNKAFHWSTHDRNNADVRKRNLVRSRGAPQQARKRSEIEVGRGLPTGCQYEATRIATQHDALTLKHAAIHQSPWFTIA